MANIIEFWLPETFPDFMVPDAIANFCEQMHGEDFSYAFIKAQQQGYKPSTKPLPHFGDNIHGFGLVFDGLVIPLIVKLEETNHD